MLPAWNAMKLTRKKERVDKANENDFLMKLMNGQICDCDLNIPACGLIQNMKTYIVLNSSRYSSSPLFSLIKESNLSMSSLSMSRNDPRAAYKLNLNFKD